MPDQSVFHFISFQSFCQVLPGQPHPVLAVVSVVVQMLTQTEHPVVLTSAQKGTQGVITCFP